MVFIMQIYNIFFKNRLNGITTDIYLGSLNKKPDNSHFNIIYAMIEASDIDNSYAILHLNLFLCYGITTHFNYNTRAISTDSNYKTIEYAILENNIETRRLERKLTDIIITISNKFTEDYGIDDNRIILELINNWFINKIDRTIFQITNTKSFKNTIEILVTKKMLNSVQISDEPEVSISIYRSLPYPISRQYNVQISDVFKNVINEYINNYTSDELVEYDTIFEIMAEEYAVSAKTLKNLYMNQIYIFTRKGKDVIFAVNEVDQLHMHNFIFNINYTKSDKLNSNIECEFSMTASNKFIQLVQDALIEFKGSSYEQQ